MKVKKKLRNGEKETEREETLRTEEEITTNRI